MLLNLPTNGITKKRKIILEIVQHFVADTDTEQTISKYFLVVDAERAAICSFKGGAA